MIADAFRESGTSDRQNKLLGVDTSKGKASAVGLVYCNTCFRIMLCKKATAKAMLKSTQSSITGESVLIALALQC